MYEIQFFRLTPQGIRVCGLSTLLIVLVILQSSCSPQARLQRLLAHHPDLSLSLIVSILKIPLSSRALNSTHHSSFPQRSILLYCRKTRFTWYLKKFMIRCSFMLQLRKIYLYLKSDPCFKNQSSQRIFSYIFQIDATLACDRSDNTNGIGSHSSFLA